VTTADETPAERLARWTARDLAIGIAAEGQQLRSQLAERRAEADDLRARLAQLTTRVAQLEAENAELHRRAGRVPLTTLARRVYRKARSLVAARRTR
jgi:phage shock protein A